ncbi:MAG: NAD(+)/NADH kinase [Deltaproteobacteria bacterium]|jgi:NAD+ kinase
MPNLTIIYKKDEDLAAQLAVEIGEWFKQRDAQVFLLENIAPHAQRSSVHEFARKIPSDSLAVVVLGGDGTLLSVARLLTDRDLPVLGVNIGGMGFLTEVSVEECYRFFEDILAQRFEVERRMRLHTSFQRKGERVLDSTVLNDVVINKAALARLVDLKVTIDGLPLTTYRADGLIVATATGSTAYNLSAGGPIVYPTAESIILTPICEFSLTNRSIVLPSDAQVEIRVGAKANDVTLTCDGQVGCELQSGDIIRVKQADRPLFLIKSRQEDYFTILRNKLKWGQR